MYAKHASLVESLYTDRCRDPGCLNSGDIEALKALVALARAATPKSPEEEREICRKLAASISSTAPVFVDAIADTRVAARVEGYWRKVCDHEIGLHLEGGYSVEVTLETKLAAAQAEIRRLCAEVADIQELLAMKASGVEIAAERGARLHDAALAQAEIAHWKTQFDLLSGEFGELSDSFIAEQNVRAVDKAEIERLRESYSKMQDMYHADGRTWRTKLAERDAEIANLRTHADTLNNTLVSVTRHSDAEIARLRGENKHYVTQRDACCRREDTLRTKLANLRTGARLALSCLEQPGGTARWVSILFDAIEASRT